MTTTVAKQEKTGIEVFGYKKIINVDEILKDQKALVKENPFVKITNNQTYTLAKINRTALRKGRTSLEGRDKSFASLVRKLRLKVGGDIESAVLITRPPEDTQQVEIDRWEKILAEKRAEKERIANERKVKMQKFIDDFKEEWQRKIDGVESGKDAELIDMLVIISNSKFDVLDIRWEKDVEEYAMVFEEAKRVLTEEYIPAKQKELTLIAEAVRLLEEKDRLKKQKEAQDKKDKETADKEVIKEAEKKRIRLLPDKERLIETFDLLINLPEIKKFKEKEAQKIFSDFEKEFKTLKKKYSGLAKKL